MDRRKVRAFIHNENTNKHLHSYAQALDIVDGKVVLDIDFGEGYGSNLLSGLATKVVGVDINETTVANALIKYRKGVSVFLTGAPMRYHAPVIILM